VFEPGSTITRLGERTFSACELLRSICIAASVEVIGEYCFHAESPVGTVALEEVTFQDNSKLREIEAFAFARCPFLSYLILPASVEVIDVRCFPVDRDVFSSHFRIDYSNCFFKMSDQYLVDFNKVSLLRYFGYESKIQMNSQIQTIGPYCFSQCASIYSVICGSWSQLRSIEPWAFERCRQLRTVTLPSTLTVLRKYCFLECGALGKVSFAPNSLLTELEEGVFGNCRHLRPIVLPPSVERIGENCFHGCVVCSNVTFASPSHLRTLLSLPPDATCGPIELPDSVEVVRIALRLGNNAQNCRGYTLKFGRESRLRELKFESPEIPNDLWISGGSWHVRPLRVFRSFVHVAAGYLKALRSSVEFTS
jgi:hypothetical protein